MDRHFPTFQQVYDERFQAKYGFWRPIIERSVTAFLQCGDLHQGFARVRCPDCQHEMFLEVPEPDIDRLHAAWRDAVFALYLAEGKIDAEVVENMRSWPHSGFHVDQSVFLPAGDRAGIERVMHYMTRCPFSLSRLVKVTESGQVNVIAFIEPRAPERSDGQGDVIAKVLRHCGLWQPSSPRAPPAKDGWGHDPQGDSGSQAATCDEPRELTYVDMATFETTF